MHAYTDSLMRDYLRTPGRCYLTSHAFDTSPVIIRSPITTSSRSPVLIRRDRRSLRPLSTSSLDRAFHKVTSNAPSSEDSVFISNFSDCRRSKPLPFPGKHLWRKEIPLCTPDELLDIIREPSGYYALPTDPWNEVYPGIYLSDAPTALCTAMLKRMGVTHVLNAAHGKEKGCGQVNTSSAFYFQAGIQFLGVPAFDNIVFRIHPYFEEAATFIDKALKSGGKVLVHCRAGISRSATLVCAFLMLKREHSAQTAIKTVRKNRAIIPNDGFLQQLCDLNDKLHPRKKAVEAF